MYKRLEPNKQAEEHIKGTPHCNKYILHAPGECDFCDHFPLWQALRVMWGIAFTDYEPEGTEFPCPSRGTAVGLVNIPFRRQWQEPSKPGTGWTTSPPLPDGTYIYNTMPHTLGPKVSMTNIQTPDPLPSRGAGEDAELEAS